MDNQQWLNFKEWVENTNLFHAIRADTKRLALGDIDYMTITSPEITFNLRSGVTVDKAEDLPPEVLYEFFIHSPFYTPNHESEINQPNSITSGSFNRWNPPLLE